MRIVSFLLLMGFTAWSALGQPYVFNSYTVGDGLPQSQVYALLTDSRGYLWLGTQGGGLARYDGRKFQNFTAKDGLSDNNVNALAEDGNGNIWVGTNAGLSRFDGRKFDFIELEPGRKVIVNAFTLLKGKHKSVLFAATGNGLYSLEVNAGFNDQHKAWSKPMPVATLPFGRLTSAHTDSKLRVWVGGDDGLFVMENGQWRTVQRRKAEVLAIRELNDGRILAGIFNSGILLLDGKKRSYLNTLNGLPSNKVQCIWQNPRDGKVWIGLQDEGLCLWSPNTGNIERINESQGLYTSNIRSILGDEFGKVVWLGTSGGGLFKYATQNFEHFGTTDGLRSNFIYALCPGRGQKGLWFSAGDRGVSYRGPWPTPALHDTLFHLDAANGFYNVKCRALHLDQQGRTWIGTEGIGLAVFDGQDSLPFHFFTKKNGLAGHWIRDIEEDAAGNIWVATTDGGISKITMSNGSLASASFKNFGLSSGLPDLTVHALHFDKKGRLWFALQTGEVGFLANGKINLLGKADGLPGMLVRSLAEDKFGHLWVGTAGSGIGFVDIYQPNKMTFRQFDLLDSLASGNVYLLLPDSHGHLWVGTEKGVDRISIDSLGRFQKVKHFGQAEGFLGVETCQNAALHLESGEIWFGTMNGLTHYLPVSDSLSSNAPIPVLTGVRLFYEPLENSSMGRWSDNRGGLVDGAVFPYNQNHLGFEFFATDFSNQERVMYSWQLVGQEGEWSPFSNRTEVSYANLPSGDYRFRLRARNEDGLISSPLEIAFSITPPIWETWWFKLSVLGGLALFLWAWFRWRIRQVKQRAAQERAQLELQNRLLTLEQKSRQLQMNPHFIFNALNSIQSLVSAGNMDSARQYILKFGRLMRAVLDNSRQALIPLDKEVETLRQYLEMEQFCRDGKFDFELDTSGIETPDLQVPPMLLQPFVENAILHGIGPLSNKKGLIQLRFSERDDHLEVTIRDNGIGIAQSQARKAGQEPDRQSVGIAVTQERLELLKSEAGFAAPAVEMHQVAGNDGEVEGTEVVVRMGC